MKATDCKQDSCTNKCRCAEAEAMRAEEDTAHERTRVVSSENLMEWIMNSCWTLGLTWAASKDLLVRTEERRRILGQKFGLWPNIWTPFHLNMKQNCGPFECGAATSLGFSIRFSTSSIRFHFTWLQHSVQHVLTSLPLHLASAFGLARPHFASTSLGFSIRFSTSSLCFHFTWLQHSVQLVLTSHDDNFP
jgi:hypothetical protein